MADNNAHWLWHHLRAIINVDINYLLHDAIFRNDVLVGVMTEEFDVMISNDEKQLLDSKQAPVSIFSVGEVGGSRLLRNSDDYLPDCTVL